MEIKSNRLEKILVGVIITNVVSNQIMYNTMDNQNYSLIPLGIALVTAPILGIRTIYRLLMGK